MSARRRWSLRTRLVVSAVTLIAVVASVIGTVTTIAYKDYMFGKLDSQLSSITGIVKHAEGARAMAGAHAGPPGADGGADDRLQFLGGGGQPWATVGAVVTDGQVTDGKYTQQNNTPTPLDDAEPLSGAQRKALLSVSLDGRIHTVELPGLGEYHVQSVAMNDGSTTLVGVPTTDVHKAISTLVLVEVLVTGSGLLAAGIAGTALVGIALRPLRRVAATATRVAELPLHSGEVAPLERVPDAEADPRTEVGQVGAALNRMLGHVGSALAVRQQSETRVRQFVADASHELRTPLASIRGYAELTRRGREQTGPDTRHALARIESEAGRMTGLVEDLLLLARLDAGRPLSYRSTDLSPLVVDAVSDARAAGQDHQWRLRLPQEPAAVSADGARLHQVLVNLLANARTHTPPGTTVTTGVRCEGAWVVVEVEDDGPGIPADLLPHVFERFARGDASRSRHAGSTGLGLAIVQAVVTAHGGTVTVRCAPGHTVFAVRLPALRSAASQGAPQQGAPQQSAPEQAAPEPSPGLQLTVPEGPSGTHRPGTG
ncbi:HAMP domain-containing sensor histidine kinase [Streptomyces sp. NPDC051322]|uniref:HAMP domain-containing sensor histidine kinase n=1 Tax=Streptomyces sp. NPDC051322 TaxID=3154645 RepID=UPI00344CE3A2